jgi:uncharacterized protein YpmB
MKKLLKIVGVLLLLIVVSFTVIYGVYNQPFPEGESGPAADALATKMLKAVNHDAYLNTRYIEWSFIDGAHHYKLDKVKGIVEVKWDEYTVDLNLSDTSGSSATKKSSVLSGKESRELYHIAWGYFNNDSFWLVAPFKVFDEGTERSIVKLKDGSDGLLITYNSGGSTPGDSYLWKLLPNGFPESFQIWANVIPIGGLEASWDDWQIMESGVFLPTTHKLGPITMSMGDVKAYN